MCRSTVEGREHDRREVYIDFKEDLEESLQAECTDEGAISLSFQMKSTFVVFPRWVSTLNVVSMCI